MHPDVVSDAADRCPKCGMKLVPAHAKGDVRQLTAKAKVASTRTIGDMYVQYFFNLTEPGISADRVLNGPTNDEFVAAYAERSFRDGTTVIGYVEPAAATAAPEQSFQFERLGYFVADRKDHRADAPVFTLAPAVVGAASWRK